MKSFMRELSSNQRERKIENNRIENDSISIVFTTWQPEENCFSFVVSLLHI